MNMHRRHGPSGTGKTLLAHAISNRLKQHCIAVKASDIFCAYVSCHDRRHTAPESALTVVFIATVSNPVCRAYCGATVCAGIARSAGTRLPVEYPQILPRE